MKRFVRSIAPLAASLAVTFAAPVWLSLSLNGDALYPRFFTFALAANIASFAARCVCVSGCGASYGG